MSFIMEREAKYYKENLTDSDLQLIFDTINNSKYYNNNLAGDFLRERDITMILTYATCGLRPGELLKLKWEDVDWESMEFKINPYNNKQREGKPAVIPISTLHKLKEFEMFSKMFIVSEYIFPSIATFGPISVSAFGKRLRDIQKQAGIYKVIGNTKSGQPITNNNIYMLRKYYANRIRRKRGVIDATIALRNKSIRTTMEHYTEQPKEEAHRIVNDCF